MRFKDTSPKLDKFRSRKIAKKILHSIHISYAKINRNLKLMHVCGTHETTVAKSGIRSLLPNGLEIISGPGCPVCICPSEHISAAIQLAKQGAIIVTFGDMFKVPDSELITLSNTKSNGYDIRIVYSINDAVKIANNNSNKKIIWLGVGFETTAPMTAFTLINNPPTNFFVLSDFRLVPPAMELLLSDPKHDLDGFVLPGHVSTIIGTKDYDQFPEKYNIPCVVGGFDALDFLIAIDMILKQIIRGDSIVENAYPRVVKAEGNTIALKMMNKVFKVVDAKWRGIGIIKKSGFELSERFVKYDAKALLLEPIKSDRDLIKGCLCGNVILGKAVPQSCPHFLKKCTPETPIGPCMVSDEGTCRIRVLYEEK